MKLTKLGIEKLPIPEFTADGKVAQKRYYDETLKGFGVRVSSGKTKAFFVEKRINGKLCRITVGRFGELTLESARKQAHALLGKIAVGIDPLAEKRTSKMQAITLQEAFQDYVKTRRSLKPKTLHDYTRLIKTGFAEWCNKPLVSITKDKVVKKHESLGNESGQAYANLAMRLLRALFNFASYQYEDAQGKSLVPENPVKRLSQARAWYNVKPRENYIKSHDLKAWYQAVQTLENETLRDYILLVIFTGLRKQEAATLKWSQVDFRAKTLTITETKNSKPLTLPLSTYLYELLMSRKNSAYNDFVFPGTGKDGHTVEPRKQMVKVTEASGIPFTIHDLRRTFSTHAESIDTSAYAIKRLINHTTDKKDVTSGYIIANVERLRIPMQAITDYLLLQMGALDSLDNNIENTLPNHPQGNRHEPQSTL